MRLWTLHPKYLDPQGLVALWREGLLARAVLRDETRGYKNHPQLDRFKSQATPRWAIDAYLSAVLAEAVARGYSFDPGKIGRVHAVSPIPATNGQMAYEWQHLLQKLASRSPALHQQWHALVTPECHPLFDLRIGQIEPWERPTMASMDSTRPKSSIKQK